MVTGLLPVTAGATGGSGTDIDPYTTTGFTLTVDGSAVTGSLLTIFNTTNTNIQLSVTGITVGPYNEEAGTGGVGLTSTNLYLVAEGTDTSVTNYPKIYCNTTYNPTYDAGAYELEWASGWRDPNNSTAPISPGTYNMLLAVGILDNSGSWVRDDYYQLGQITLADTCTTLIYNDADDSGTYTDDEKLTGLPAFSSGYDKYVYYFSIPEPGDDSIPQDTSVSKIELISTADGSVIGSAMPPWTPGSMNNKLWTSDTYNGIAILSGSASLAGTDDVGKTFRICITLSNGKTYTSAETYTVEAAPTSSPTTELAMTVQKNGQPVTSFSNTDTITITATLPTAPTSVTSVFFNDPAGESAGENWLYLEDGIGSVSLSGSTVTITLSSLYKAEVKQVGDEWVESKGDPLPPGNYKISFWDDFSGGSTQYISNATYTVTGEDGTGNNTCSVSFATDPNFENPVTSVTPSSTEYYVRATDFSPALPYGSQYGVMIKATGSSAVYTLTGTPSFVQDPSGNTAYLQRGPIEFQLGGQDAKPAAGMYELTVSVYENAGMTGEPLYTYTSTNQMTVTAATVSTPTIITGSLPGGVTGTAYSQTLKATPGTAGKAITWSISANKPDWLNINANTGVLTGTPTAAGNYTFTVTAREADGGETSKSFTIAVTQAITSAGLTVTGGSYSPGDSISVIWNMSGALPGSATADLTLYYNNGQTAECPMTRYSNYFYAYVELPKDCTSVEKLSASATIGSQTVTGENTNPDITMKGKLSLTWTSLANSGTLTIRDSSNETVATRSLSKNSTGLELSLPAGEYTLSATAYVGGLGNQTLLEGTTVAVTEGATTAQSLSFETLQAVTYRPAVKPEGGNSTSSYSLYWYGDAAGEDLLATGKSYTALSTATLYVKAVPTYSVSATHGATTVIQASQNMTLTLPAKLADTVTVNVQCEDVAGGADIKTVSGYVVLSQPGADGYKKTTQKRVYNAGAVTFEGVTAGSTITFTPDQKYACGPVSTTIDSVTGGSKEISLNAGALEGVISSNITLLYADRTMNLTFTTMSNLKVKKDDGTVIPHHRTSGNILVLDDLTGLNAGDTLTISGQYGAGDFPIAVFEKKVTLSGEDLSATADITMTARGTARISVQNQSRVAADLLLYQGDQLFYTKETFIASHASTYDYVYSSGWSPRLPAGSYTVYVVNRDYLNTVDPNVRHPGECDGQSGYGVKKLDGIIDRIVRYQFSKISAVSGEDIVAKQNQKAIELAKARHHLATMQLAEKQRELVDYQNEGIKVIRGQSKFDMEFLNELVSKAKAEVTELEAAVDAAKEELDIHLANDDIERKEYEKIKTWADLYDNCNFAAKKMIISQFIKSVYVYRDYTLEIEFNVSFEEFRTMATECQDQGTNEQPLVYITA